MSSCVETFSLTQLRDRKTFLENQLNIVNNLIEENENNEKEKKEKEEEKEEKKDKIKNKIKIKIITKDRTDIKDNIKK